MSSQSSKFIPQSTSRRLASINFSSSGAQISKTCRNSRVEKQRQWQHQLQQAVARHHSEPDNCASLADAYTAAQHTKQQQQLHTTTGSSSSSRRLSLHALQQLLQCRPACEHAALLTAAIKACSGWHEAAALYSHHSHEFNHIHTAALISHLPKVLRRQQQQQPLHCQDQADLQLLFRDLAQLAEEVLPHCSGRELANIAHGFAAVGFYSRRLMQLMLCRCDLASLKPQELANLTWAVAKLNHEMHEGWTAQVLALSQQYMVHNPTACSYKDLQQHLLHPAPQDCSTHLGRRYGAVQNPNWPEHAGFKVQKCQSAQQQDFRLNTAFKPQELVNTAWGLAVMQRHCLLSSAPPLRYSCTRVDAAWIGSYCAAAAALLPDYKPADVVMGMWAVAVLGARAVQQQWMDGQLQRAVELVDDMQGRHIAVLLWSVSQVQRQQQQRRQRYASRDSATAVTSNTNSNSKSAQQFAYACFPRLLQLLQSEQQQQHLQVICVVLSSLAHLQVPPPAAAMHAMLQAAARQLQQQSRSSWSDMQQQQQQFAGISSGMMWQRRLQQAVRFDDVSLLLYALAKLQYRPCQWLLAAAMRAAATACWQHLLAMKHSEQQWGQQQQCCRTLAVQPKEVAVLLWSLGKLYCQPPPHLLRLLYKVSAARISSCSSADVGMIFWGLARMRARPRYVWLQQMVKQFLLGLDDGIVSAADVCNVVHALPLLPGGRNLNAHLREKLQTAGHLQQLAAAAQQRFGECGAQELVQLVQGFARLGFRPEREWISQHETCCAEVGEARFSPQERQALAAAKAVLAKLPEHQQPSLPLQQQQLLLKHQLRVQQLAAV